MPLINKTKVYIRCVEHAFLFWLAAQCERIIQKGHAKNHTRTHAASMVKSRCDAFSSWTLLPHHDDHHSLGWDRLQCILLISLRLFIHTFNPFPRTQFRARSHIILLSHEGMNRGSARTGVVSYPDERGREVVNEPPTCTQLKQIIASHSFIHKRWHCSGRTIPWGWAHAKWRSVRLASAATFVGGRRRALAPDRARDKTYRDRLNFSSATNYFLSFGLIYRPPGRQVAVGENGRQKRLNSSYQLSVLSAGNVRIRFSLHIKSVACHPAWQHHPTLDH